MSATTRYRRNRLRNELMAMKNDVTMSLRIMEVCWNHLSAERDQFEDLPMQLRIHIEMCQLQILRTATVTIPSSKMIEMAIKTTALQNRVIHFLTLLHMQDVRNRPEDTNLQ
ncbi:unnamed protein product [Caenorhabditis bovis]|uniref:Uncharacterized protein n=1 Tax=Caenorhabditis bovis TaxID=2654633 RepID=A0A8S1ECY8_9PELO|nr:unnamed protein product [Caenorhabditis bovis]